jgi:prevent-host-death family protein
VRAFEVDHVVWISPEVAMLLEQDDITTIAVTEFRGRCLAVIDDVAQGRTGPVVLMKRNRPVAAIVPIDHDPPDLWGAMRGSVIIPAGTDLTAPGGELREAEA